MPRGGLDVAIDRRVDQHAATADAHRALDRRAQRHLAAAHGDVARHRALRPELDLTATDAHVAADRGIDDKPATGGIEVLADRGRHAQVAAGKHRIAADRRIDVDIAAGRDQVARHRPVDAHRAAEDELVDTDAAPGGGLHVVGTQARRQQHQGQADDPDREGFGHAGSCRGAMAGHGHANEHTIVER